MVNLDEKLKYLSDKNKNKINFPIINTIIKAEILNKSSTLIQESQIINGNSKLGLSIDEIFEIDPSKLKTYKGYDKHKLMAISRNLGIGPDHDKPVLIREIIDILNGNSSLIDIEINTKN